MIQGYFCLTNDPDHGLYNDYKIIFKNLTRFGIFSTTAVFCTLKQDNSVLSKHCNFKDTHSLEDKNYLRLMLEAKDNGHEIAFHGYSQVSDTREEFLRGLDIFNKIFKDFPKTFIEHGYHPKKHPLENCKSENLAVLGSTPDSKYYIKDIVADVFEVVWTHDFLVDELIFPLPLSEIFVTIDGITYFKRWRNKNLERLFQNVNHENNTIIAYTHFGYRGYKSRREKYFFWEKQKYPFENWIGADSLRNSRILREMIQAKNLEVLTINQLFRRFNAA